MPRDDARWQVPYECKGVKPILVGYCPVCEYLYDPYPGPHTECDGEHDWPNQGKRFLLKRRFWRCPALEICDMYFPSLHALRYHEHSLAA